MRTPDHQQQKLFFYFSAESRVPATHPLRPVKTMVEQFLKKLEEKFQKMYSSTGRPSIPPERLIKALLLQVLYTIRSERALMEHIDFNILFRWFIGLSIDEPVWDHSSFSKNRDRLIEADIAVSLLESVLEKAGEEGLLSKEHFSVDGTLLEAWASMKSFRPKDEPPPPAPETSSSGQDRNPEVDFHGEKRSNDTHASTTDPDARLAKKGKGKEAKLCYTGHILTENRNGLVVEARVTQSTGTCEREAGEKMLSETEGKHRKTVGADKAYDTKDFVDKCRKLKVTPHVAQKKNSAIDGRTTSHAGYTVSQRKRKRIEEVFGWGKTVGGLRKLRHRGLKMVEWVFTFTVAAYNLVRMRNLGVV